MSPINVRKLISEVRKRPALYNRRCTEYGDKGVKDKLWREVYANVVQRWAELSPELQQLKGKQLQKRWNYLTELYRKNLKKKFKRTEGKLAKPRRYGYISQLRFLGTSQTRDEKSPSRSERDETGSEDELDNIGKDRIRSGDSKVSREQKLQNRQLQQKVTVNLQRNISIERQAKRVQKTRPTMRQEKQTKERCKQNVYMNMDEDECFLMSLLPAMRRFEGEHKFTAKIEIMSAVKKVMASQNTAKPSARSQKHMPSTLAPSLKINSTTITIVKPKKETEIPSSTGLQSEKSGSEEANNSDLYDDVIYLDETLLDDSEIKSEE